MSEKFSALQPDLVFASQGNLGISALAVLAARRANLRCISYIPMAHSFRKMHSKYGRLRDWSNNYIVRIPDRWLTCTIEQIQKLRDQGAQQPIDILPNCIDLPQMATPSEARGRLSLKIGDLVIGMVGRLNNVQKGCDLFIETLNAAPKGSPLREAKLLFIGEGVDWGITRRQLEQNGWRGRILHLEWTGVPAEYLAAFDLLVMPSHFEGLPLSMQEAVLCNVPVAASAVDGLASFLPKNWLCAPNNSHALLGLLENFIQDPDEYRKALPALQQKIRNEHSTDAFHAALKKNFAATLHKM
jgi:glycosyltransferase involved in cell wall biosynthesis